MINIRTKYFLDYTSLRRRIKQKQKSQPLPSAKSSSLFSKTSVVTLLGFYFITSSTKAQIQQLKNPKPSNFQTNNSHGTNAIHLLTMQIGATADDISRQANQGNQNYGYRNDLRTNQSINEAQIRAQMMNDPAYNPSLRNGSGNNYPIDKQEELHQLLQEIATNDNIRFSNSKNSTIDYTSKEFLKRTQPYADAIQALKDMLNGKRKLSLKDAYFTIEKAYGETYLSNQEYNNIITQSANFIKQWMQQNNQDIHNNENVHNAIQQFLSQKLSITNNQLKLVNKTDIIVTPINANGTTHLPFQYDFNDYSGEKDHRNFFLTKCLATGTGQCNSLPAVYLTLAEALGAQAYLSIAPQHSLIKYPDNKGAIQNYEPTSNWKISDQWYLDNMFIKNTAVEYGIYLSPLNKKQIVADCIIQLAFGYFKKFGIADSKFVKECINASKAEFPRNNNISIYFTYSNLYASQLVDAMRKNGINKISDTDKFPETKLIYAKLRENESIIKALGYQDMPKDMYDEIMKEHEFKGKIQSDYHFTGKEKRNLFIETK